MVQLVLDQRLSPERIDQTNITDVGQVFMMFLQNLEGKFLAGLEVLDEVDFSEKAAAKELLHRKVFEIETIPT